MKTLTFGDKNDFYGIDKKQTYHNVITGKENASKEGNCITSMFLMGFMFCEGFRCFLTGLVVNGSVRSYETGVVNGKIDLSCISV